MESGSHFDASRAELFEALGHPTRVKILRTLETTPMGFAELKREVGIESSGQLQFHLGKLTGLVTTNAEGSYTLTDDGREAIRVLKAIPTGSEQIHAVSNVSHRRDNWVKPLLAVLLIAIVVLAGAGVGYLLGNGSAEDTFRSQEVTISSQASAIQGYLGLLASDSQRAASLNATINSDTAIKANLTAQVNADLIQIRAISEGYNMTNRSLATLQSEVLSDQNLIGYYEGQVSYLTSQVSNLQTQVNVLYAVLELSDSYVPGPAQTVSVPPRDNVTFLTFTEAQAGYIVVNMSATNDLKNAGFTVFNGYNSQVIKEGSHSGIFLGPYRWTAVPDFVSVPVIPGPVTVYLFNTGPNTVNMTVSVTDIF